jgi:hypothetical protein
MLLNSFGYKGLFTTWLRNYTHQISKYDVEPQCESKVGDITKKMY